MVKFLTLLMLVAPVLSFAHETCIPENNLYISSNLKSAGSVSEKDFNDAIDELEAIYMPIFKDEYKSKLVVERKWDDGTVNAYAFRRGSDWYVAMFGGLARHPETTKDGFSAVICHEIGHHIGGAPRKGSWMSAWASNEGQSDYFATNKCLKKLFQVQEELTLKIYHEEKLDEDQKTAELMCQSIHSSELEAAICYRGAMAGKSLARLLGSLRGNADVSFSTPDPSVVSKTDHNHPQAQCRMDTYFQGALCDKDKDLKPSATDAAVGYCMRSESYQVGVRPLCWYKPEE
jgi:hypothetical protein